MTRLTKERITLYVLAYVFLLIGCSGSGEPSQSTPAPVTSNSSTASLSETITVTLDEYLQSNFAEDEAGIVVQLRHGGNVSYQRTKGLANRQQNIPVTLNTSFRLASLSKPFTAIAIMQLIERELISLDDSILKHLPELDESWRLIEVSHLLSHRTGIPEFFTASFNGLVGLEWYNGLNNGRVFDYFTLHPERHFTANSKFEYSNTNYVLLALIIERVSGLNFTDYMQTYIFQPTGLNHTYIIDQTRIPFADEALNYATTHLIYDYPLYFNGAAGQVSSSADLVLLAEALKGDSLIQQSTLMQMLEIHSATDSTGTKGFGLGWQIDTSTKTGNRYFYHIGSIDGFRSLLAIEPSSDTILVILTNKGDEGEQHALNLFNKLIHDLGL